MAIYESVMNLNETNGKFAKWVFRVLSPRIVAYSFTARGQAVQAERFDCILVSDDPTEYLIGCVPFQFGNTNAARDAE